jgi:hypothetical protein
VEHLSRSLVAATEVLTDVTHPKGAAWLTFQPL